MCVFVQRGLESVQKVVVMIMLLPATVWEQFEKKIGLGLCFVFLFCFYKLDSFCSQKRYECNRCEVMQGQRSSLIEVCELVVTVQR